MANTLNIGGSITLAFSNTRVSINLVDNYNPTGSNFITNNATVVTGSWSTLDQASNTSYRYGVFVNTDTTSSIQIAVNQSASLAAWLQPGDVAIIPYSGSASLYAKAIGANGSPILQYTLVEV